MSTSSPDPGRHERPFDAEEFARQTVSSIETGDAIASVLERRVTRIEEIIAARWPRSMFLRWRLAREVRASVAQWDPEYIAPGDFYARRLAAASDEADGLLDRQQRARAEGWPEPGAGQEEAPGGDSGQPGADPGAGFLP